ncbi:Na+/H+ antiporter subunit A [Alkalihalobacillus trypoxylicola]|uniref:Cation:proton antiporter n=1 Tax=Alkalihalobacillus trypoxylicola TaxID=519424 RepID=A0A161QB21_9BACI|nr:Na+/H+ antiporter subunit A [Alkalihalobacillus trypoxylicola]KYG35077.1 cation:proton antiporter [Alkalihalobacillus trypoxylicola]
MSILHLAILSPFLIAITIPFIRYLMRNVHIGWYVLATPLILFLYFFQFVSEIRTGKSISHQVEWVPSLDLNFSAYLDGLGLLFALLITGMGALVILYSIFYLDKRKEKLHNFYVYLLLFMGAMLGIVTSDHLMILYVFWELTTLASALLIGFWFHREKSTYGARKSLLITVFGGFSMMAGFLLLYIEAQTFSIQALINQSETLMSSPLFIPAMLLVLLGAFTKSAQFPFHIWLPDAMEAPTPVSAYLHSATMVKAGIYLMARLTPLFGLTESWSWLLLSIGLLTLLWGAISAIRQTDLKAILAYSTISQLGLIVVLLGIGSKTFLVTSMESKEIYAAAILTAIIHLINHATFKGSLFMVVGIIDHETGTRSIKKLGGLMALMPVSCTLSIIGLAAMAGIPPFNGFISKEMFFTNLLSIGEMGIHSGLEFMIPFVGWVASVGTFLYCSIIFFRTFTGDFDASQYDKKVHEAPIGMLISPIILAALVLILGIFPNLWMSSIVEPTVLSILPELNLEQIQTKLSLWHGINLELMMSLAVIILGFFLYRKLPFFQNKYSFFKKEREPLHTLFDRSIEGLDVSSKWITNLQMTGSLRDYMVFMLLFIIGVVGYTFYRFNSVSLQLSEASYVPPYVIGILLILIISTLAIPFMKNRITLIIVLGLVGLSISLIFAIFSAQDLALTQLLVETVTIMLLLLTFRYLPAFKPEFRSKRKKGINLLISISVGLGVFLIGASAFSFGNEVDFDPVSDFYIENAYELGGGTNIVNVILVDFRALDTLLEVLVLGIVGLAIITLVRHRLGRGEDV